MKYDCPPPGRAIGLWFLPVIFLFFFAYNLHAQDPVLVPQFEQYLREAKSDSARAMALQYLSFNLAHTDPARSMAHGEEALRVAEKSGDPWLLAQCQNGVGWAHFARGNFARARSLLDSAIVYMRATRDYLDLAAVCNNQGWACLKLGDKLGALQYFREGLNAAEASGDKSRIAFMNRSLGSYYNAQNEYDKSIPHIQEAYGMFEALGDSAQMIECTINLGNAYSGWKQYETAISYYKKALPITRKQGDLLQEGLLYENWGFALSRLGRFDEAFVQLEASRRLFERLDERVELAYLHQAIGSAHLLKRDTAQAILSFEKALAFGRELELDDVVSEVLSLLHTSYFAVGLPGKAYRTLLDYQALRDTGAAEARNLDLQRLQTEFETERKEKDIQIKTLENARLQSRFWLALAGFGLALAAGFAAWYRARQRRKTNRVLEAKNLEILAQKAEADRLRVRAQHSEAAKQKFLAAMSHEIRTPMNAIVGLSQLLDAGKHDPVTARNISIIRQSGEHLMTILNDILDLAKIAEQKIELRPQPVALRSQLELIRDTFAALAREKGLELQLEAGESLPKHIVADPVRLGQVLNNLVSNAVKFTDAGEVVLSARPAHDSASQFSNVSISRITFSVKDTGIGIPPEKQAAVFEEFTQVDSGVNRAYGGTGLGLSIARRLVEQMGGQLQLRSMPGQGSEFFFTLDFPVPDAEELTAPVHGEGRPAIPRLTCTASARVLLVEDNEFNQAVASQTVAAICPDLKMDVADSGEQALELVKTRQYDLVMTDLQMPGLDGYETARRLRAAGFARPVIALTASALRSDERKCHDAGMEEMLLKPIAPADMAEMLLRHISGKLAVLPAEDLREAVPLTAGPDRPIPPSLLHFAGGNAAIARELLSVIRTELNEHLPAFRACQAASDDAGIRKKVHKMRPQLVALGLQEQRALFDALEHSTLADPGFWANARTLESMLEKTLAEL